MNKLQSVGFLFFVLGVGAFFGVDTHQATSITLIISGALLFLLGAE